MEDILLLDHNLHDLSIDIGSEIDKDELLGEFLHLCLYYLENYDGQDHTIERAVKCAFASAPNALRYRLDESDISMVHGVILSALSVSEIKELFSTKSYNLREAEFFSEDGAIIRVDRLNYNHIGVTEVVEYKLRRPPNLHFVTEYRNQVLQYMKVVYEIFRRKTKGVIVYFEDRELEVIDGW